MEELLKYFDWIALIMGAVITSLLLSVANHVSEKASTTSNKILAPIISFALAILLNDWTGFLQNWQDAIIKFLLIGSVGCILGMTRGQDLIDSFLGFLLNKAGIKNNEPKP